MSAESKKIWAVSVPTTIWVSREVEASSESEALDLAFEEFGDSFILGSYHRNLFGNPNLPDSMGIDAGEADFDRAEISLKGGYDD